jgi:hypothetical protein
VSPPSKQVYYFILHHVSIDFALGIPEKNMINMDLNILDVNTINRNVDTILLLSILGLGPRNSAG